MLWESSQTADKPVHVVLHKNCVVRGKFLNDQCHLKTVLLNVTPSPNFFLEFQLLQSLCTTLPHAAITCIECYWYKTGNSILSKDATVEIWEMV